jgi:hypothetical protein
MFLGNVTPTPDVLKETRTRQIFIPLKPLARLDPGAQSDHPVVVAVPPVPIGLAHQLWGPVPELGLNPTGPEVGRFKHMIVR